MELFFFSYSHIKIHEQDKNFPCDRCNVKLLSEEKLTRHFKKFHADVQCEICGRNLLNGDVGLKKHIIQVHGDEIKNILCEKCDYRTHSKSNLNVHIKHMHTKRPKFLCNICNQILSDKRGLQIHIGKKSSTRFLFGFLN